MAKRAEYTVFQGRAGDHNDLAIPGAKAIGEELESRTGISPTVIGTPAPALNTGWHEELDAALPSLKEIQSRFDDVFARGTVSIAATSRCAVSLATLPAVAKHFPSACIVWFDAHGDLNPPEASPTGYLGGLALAGAIGLWDSGLGAGLGLDQVVLVGQRDLDPFELDLIATHNIPLITPDADLATELRNAISGRCVYVHLDCDVLEPGIVPTDYKHEGGLSLDDLRVCCELIAEHDFIGIEIAEFQSAWEANGSPVSPSALLDALQPVLR
ncbi:arginase family protein [Rhizobium grahamii]|uniref:Arginase n=1 Tax=Rhizobium grahamii TaxID=1120045 RepID=A0A370KUV8_9HYPH|nr:arginase family protein [Rhizobium grahamii]RDJ15296.1 arginase [Rhizobium grahamii]